MAATNTQNGTTWTRWLDDQLAHKGWSQRELARQAGFDHSRISKWKRGEGPDIPTIRSICHVLDVAAVEGFIAAGILTADDVGATVIQRPDVGLLSNAELLAELSRRLVEPAVIPPSRREEFIDRAHPGEDESDSMSTLLGALQASVNAAKERPAVVAINAYLEEKDDQGHTRLVRIDPRRFGQEGETWAARRRDDQGQTAQEG